MGNVLTPVPGAKQPGIHPLLVYIQFTTSNARSRGCSSCVLSSNKLAAESGIWTWRLIHLTAMTHPNVPLMESVQFSYFCKSLISQSVFTTRLAASSPLSPLTRADRRKIFPNAICHHGRGGVDVLFCQPSTDVDSKSYPSQHKSTYRT